MGDVVAYYCGGTKPIIELLVSIHSLRKFYDGEIVVCLGHTSVPYLSQLINSGEVTVCKVPGSEKDYSLQHHWRSRWAGMAMVKGDRVLHPDCDIVYAKNIDPLFDLLHPEDEWITSFHTVTDGERFPQWKEHVKEYKKVDPNFDIMDPFYIEFGLIGWRGAWPHCMEVSRVCEITKDDQTAMSYVLMKHGRKAYVPPLRHPALRRVRAYWRLDSAQYDSTFLWHCHPEYYLWWEAFWEAHADNYMGLGDMDYVGEINRKVWKIIRRKQYPTVDNRQ